MTELDEAYRVLARPLANAVRLDVSAPEAVIEDACQSAWARLTVRAPDVRERFSWLTRTARREAVRLNRLAAREVSLEAMLEEEHDRWAVDEVPETLAEQRELLRLPASLPPRQQNVLWLKAFGFGYEEISALTGDSVRTVQRQLLRGRRAVRRASAAQ